MSRVTVVVIAVLMIAWSAATATDAAAASPVQNVQCSIGDDGAGFTSAQILRGSAVNQSGQNPAPAGCGSGSAAAPPDATVSGTCAPANNGCSATGSASSTGSTTASVSSTGAVLGATAHATAHASTSGQGNDLSASGEQSISGFIRFTITEPSTFSISGSTSSTGHNDSPAMHVHLSGGTAGTLFQLTSGSNATTGQLSPGTYFADAFVDASARANFNSSDPSASSGSSTVDAHMTLTITAGGGCTATGTPSVQVGLALAEGCFSERQDAQGHGTGVFETDQEAWVGGFDLKPRSQGKLVIEPGNTSAPIRAEGAGVDWVLSDSVSLPAPLAELKPFTPSYTLGLNIAGSLERLVALPLLNAASAQIKVTWGPGGASSKLEGQVSLEDLSKNIGTAFSNATGRSLGTLAAKLTLALSNNAPIDVTQGELQVPEFAVELKDSTPPLKLGFGGAKFKAAKVNGQVTWSGEVTTLFPWEGETGPNQGAITGRLFFTDSQLGGVGLGVSGFAVPIGESGWDLTGVEGNLVLRPHLSFDIGATLKERINFAGVPVLKSTLNIRGFQLAATDCPHGQNPFEFTGSFNSPTIEEEKLGLFKGTVTMCAYLPSALDFSFEAGVSGELTVDVGRVKKLVSAKGSATGWFQGSGNRFGSTDFNLDGSYQVTLPVIGNIAATGVVSSEGYGFCGTYGFISEGFGTQNWVDPPQDLSGCDLTPFRVIPHAADIAAAGRGRVVNVPAGEGVLALAVRGSGAAPRVRVSGPGGVSFVTPTGARPLKNRNAIIVPVDQLRTTYIYLHRPRAGAWRITQLPGSAAIVRVDRARQLAKPRVTAKLTRLRGGKLKLAWNARAIPGQRLRLLDRTPATTTVVQRLTARHRGSVTFRPAATLTRGKHTIEADVFQNGRPRAQLTVLRYTPAAPSRPAAVTHAAARRTSSGLSVTWSKAVRATDYLVTVTSGTETIAATDTRRTSLLITSPPLGALTVRITPRDGVGRTGRVTILHVA